MNNLQIPLVVKWENVIVMPITFLWRWHWTRSHCPGEAPKFPRLKMCSLLPEQRLRQRPLFQLPEPSCSGTAAYFLLCWFHGRHQCGKTISMVNLASIYSASIMSKSLCYDKWIMPRCIRDHFSYYRAGIPLDDWQRNYDCPEIHVYQISSIAKLKWEELVIDWLPCFWHYSNYFYLYFLIKSSP